MYYVCIFVYNECFIYFVARSSSIYQSRKSNSRFIASVATSSTNKSCSDGDDVLVSSPNVIEPEPSIRNTPERTPAAADISYRLRDQITGDNVYYLFL